MIYMMTNRSGAKKALVPKNQAILKKVAIGVCIFVVAYAIMTIILKSVE